MKANVTYKNDKGFKDTWEVIGATIEEINYYVSKNFKDVEVEKIEVQK